MKHQRKSLHAEYAARRNEFESYFAFLEAKCRESLWQASFWTKVAGAGQRPGDSLK